MANKKPNRPNPDKTGNGGGGTEQGLMIVLSKLFQYYSTAPDNRFSTPKPQANVLIGAGSQEFGPGTVNHKFLRIVAALGLAFLNGTPEELKICLKRLENFLLIQEERGHCCVAEAIEFNSPTHSQLNIAAAGMAYLILTQERMTLARAYTLLLRWFYSEVTLMDLGFLHDVILGKNGYDNTCACPGWRAKTQDGSIVCTNSGRDLAYRIIRGLKVPTRAQVYAQKYNLGAAALRAAGNLSIIIPPLGWVVPAPYTVQVWKRVEGRGSQSDFVYEIKGIKHEDVCTWAVFNGAKLACGTADLDFANILESKDYFVSHRFNQTPWSQANRPK